MAKKLLSLTLIMFMVTSVLLTSFAILPQTVLGAVITVNPGDSIQTAIDGAADGDTILIKAGTYNENITISKSLTLEGEDPLATIIDGQGIPIGIKVVQSLSVNIINLTVKDFDKGIQIVDSIDVQVQMVTVLGCGFFAIEADNTNDLKIANCNLSGKYTGIGIDGLQINGLSVENTSVRSFLSGMSIRFSDDPFLYGNNVISNLNSGIILEDNTGGTVCNNYIANHASNGLKIGFTDSMLVKDNTVINSTGKGLYLTRAEITIISISIDTSDYGIYSEDISKCRIYNSSILNSNIADAYVGLDHLTLINTTFDFEKVIISKNNAFLEVRNYLEVVVRGTKGNIIAGADVIITDGEEVVYDSTEGDKKTDSMGSTGLIETGYTIYQYAFPDNYSLLPGQTSADVFYNSFEIPIAEGDSDDIDMSTSHSELFLYDNTPPEISDVSAKGNNSGSLNTLDRNDDDSLAISFSANERGQYVIIFDTDFDGEFNASNDTAVMGNVVSGYQTIYWSGENESGLLTDGIYPLKIIITDAFDNEILEPHTAITIVIANTDSDSDGYLDINDDLPFEPTQWIDNDGDGFGDNPSGVMADLFPQDPTQWFDSDGDGYGDNLDGNNPDLYPMDSTQWKDSDGDGFGDNISGNNSDAFPDDPTQWSDRDGDGWGDNESGENPDEFPDNVYEWKDSDGDGKGDNRADAFPNDPNEWKDSDSDGMGDNSDFLPSINNFLFFFIVGLTVVIILAGLYVFRGQKRAERPFETGERTVPQVAGAPPVQEPVKSGPPPPRRAQEHAPKKTGKPPAPKKRAEPKKKAPSQKPPAKEEPPPPPPPPPGDKPEEAPPPPEEKAEKED